MRLFAAFAVFGLMWSTAGATDIHITCEKPTLNTDGSVLTDLAGINLYGGLLGQTKRLLVTKSTVCDFVRSNVASGVQQYFVTAVNARDIESDPSGIVSQIVAEPPPPPPPLVTVSVVVYALVNGNDRLTFLIVGSAPLGTVCDRNQVANGFNVIPRSAVTWDGPTKPTTVLARCQ
jgi:hypothetical protein